MKVLLIDDHPLVLDALTAVLRGLGPSVSVTSVSTGCAARDVLARRHADISLVLLDLYLSDVDGFSLLRELRCGYPGVPVLVVSGTDRSTDMGAVINAGAVGFVTRCADQRILLRALRDVLSGKAFAPQTHPYADEPWPVRDYRLKDIRADVLRSLCSSSGSILGLGLTPRQHDTLICLVQGKSNKAIARELGISAETVKNHMNAVMRALGVKSRIQAVLTASRMMDLPLGRRTRPGHGTVASECRVEH